jgi:hypothetical protein
VQVKLKVTTRHYANKNYSKIKYVDGIKGGANQPCAVKMGGIIYNYEETSKGEK